VHPGTENRFVASTAGARALLWCADFADAQQRILAAGGEIVQAVFAFPGGRRFHVRDLDGYVLAVWSDQG
jgi:predicted enzyme related to lactoylglutathione lyase